jgi:polar amino acid transport system substrate-binding protein
MSHNYEGYRMPQRLISEIASTRRATKCGTTPRHFSQRPGFIAKTLRRFLILMGAIFVCISQGTGAAAETVRITTGEWEPFISEKYKDGGVILHIVQEAFTRKGLDVEFAFFPWARAVKYVDDGKWDAMAVTGSRYSEAGVSHLYSEPVYIGRDVIFYLKNKPLAWQSFSELAGLTFGAVLSYNYTDEYRQALNDGKISQVIAPKPHLLFPMLAANRFDAFIMDKNAGMYTYNTRYRAKLGDAITYSPQPVSSIEYSIRFSGAGEKSLRLQRIFNASLNEMRAAGTIDLYYKQFENGYYSSVE